MKGFLEPTVVQDIASALNLNQDDIKCVCTNFLLSLNRSIHDHIWIFRCDKQIKWEETHNIAKRKHDKSFQKHSIHTPKRTPFIMPSTSRVASNTPLSVSNIDQKILYTKNKEARINKEDLTKKRSNSNILRKISHNIIHKWSAIKKFSWKGNNWIKHNAVGPAAAHGDDASPDL